MLGENSNKSQGNKRSNISNSASSSDSTTNSSSKNRESSTNSSSKNIESSSANTFNLERKIMDQIEKSFKSTKNNSTKSISGLTNEDTGDKSTAENSLIQIINMLKKGDEQFKENSENNKNATKNNRSNDKYILSKILNQLASNKQS